MKKIVLIALIFSPIFSFSQLERGSLLLGGNASVSGAFSKNSGTYNFQLNPNIGVFVKNKFAIGSSLNFGNQNIYSGSTTYFSAVSLGISPFARYYFLPLENKFNLFGQVAIGFDQNYIVADNVKSARFTISPSTSFGATYFIRPQIALEGRLNVSPNLFNYGPAPLLGLNFRGSVGFQIHLNKPSK